VAEVHQISDPEDGVQLCSYTEEPDDAEAYTKLIKLRAQKSLHISRIKEREDELVKE
jgi:hypothetical protein